MFKSRLAASNQSSAPLCEQLVAVVHQAPGVVQPVELFDYLGVDVQKRISIGIVVEDIFAPVTAR